jgi:hypothetical protein
MKHWTNKAFSNIYGLEEVRIASKTFIVMLVPVFSVLILLELFIPKASIVDKVDSNNIAVDPNLKIYILYLTAAATHIILSIIVTLFLFRKLFRNNSNIKRRIILKRLILFILLIIFLFLISDSLQTNLALLSHERIYSYLTKSEYFNKYFQMIPSSHFLMRFYIFSFIPFTLIVLGLIIIVLTCFNIGKDLAEVLDKIRIDSKESDREKFQNKISEFQNYLYILSFILATSTIATILFFQVPLTIIKDGEYYKSFQSVSLSMGICWGVVFSLTMFAMCLYPFFVIQKRLGTLIESSDVAGNENTKLWLEKLQENYLIYRNIKSMISVVTPVVISLLAQVV